MLSEDLRRDRESDRRKRGEDVFLTREFRIRGEDQVCAHYALSCVKNALFASATESMAAQCLASFRRPNPLQPERISRRGTAALTKLGVTWSLPKPNETTTRTFNTDPLNPVVRVKGRFSRRLRTAIRSWSLRDKPSLQDLLEVQRQFELPSRSSSKRTGMS